jgi:hypothetical protein
MAQNPESLEPSLRNVHPSEETKERFHRFVFLGQATLTARMASVDRMRCVFFTASWIHAAGAPRT